MFFGFGDITTNALSIAKKVPYKFCHANVLYNSESKK